MLMKKLLMLGVFCSILSVGYTQCEKLSVSKTSSGRFIQNNVKQADIPFEATITISKEKITLSGNIAGQSINIDNEIKSVVLCEWKEYLKNGQSVYKVTTDKGNGVFENSIIKIIAKDGKTTISFAAEADEKNGLELDIFESWIEKQ